MKYVLTLLMILSLFSTAFAIPMQENRANQTDIISIMAKIEPFMKLNSDKTIQFDSITASKTLNEQTIQIGKIYERFHNSTINAVSKNQQPFQTLQDKEDLKVFEPFFAAVQKNGATTTKELINSIQSKSITSVAEKGNLYSKKPLVLNFSEKKKIQTISLACNGGGPTAPAYCPGWQFPSTQYSTLTTASNAVRQMGYHNTYSPGCGYGNPCNVDFTKWIYANGCNLGVFRSQAIPYQSGAIWKLKFQSPEPNPEIYSYTWPAAVWWGPYVFWWHTYYC